MYSTTKVLIALQLIISIDIKSSHSSPIISFTEFHTAITNASKPLVPLNQTLLTSQLTHIDLPKYITEPSSLQLAQSATRKASSYSNPPHSALPPSQPGPNFNYGSRVSHNKYYNNRNPPGSNSGNSNNNNNNNNYNNNHKKNVNLAYNGQASNNYNQNVSGRNHRNNYTSRPRGRGRLRSPLPQPAPPLENIGYDYDYDASNDEDQFNDAREIGMSQYSKSSLIPKSAPEFEREERRQALSPKVSKYRSKGQNSRPIVDRESEIRSSKGSHRSEDWSLAPSSPSDYFRNRRASSSRRSNYYSRASPFYPRPYPSEYFYSEPAFDDYTGYPGPSTGASRPHRVRGESGGYSSGNLGNEDYNFDSFDTPPKGSEAYSDSSDSDSTYEKDPPSASTSAGGGGSNEESESDSLDDETALSQPDIAETEPESDLTDPSDNSNAEEVLDDDDTKEVRSQTLYTSGSDEIPSEMRLPYHNTPLDEREIASDSFLTKRELESALLVDSAKIGKSN